VDEYLERIGPMKMLKATVDGRNYFLTAKERTDAKLGAVLDFKTWTTQPMKPVLGSEKTVEVVDDPERREARADYARHAAQLLGADEVEDLAISETQWEDYAD
jgi:hypothetical protein